MTSQCVTPVSHIYNYRTTKEMYHFPQKWTYFTRCIPNTNWTVQKQKELLEEKQRLCQPAISKYLFTRV